MKDKYISNSDYSNTSAEPTPNLMCFPPFKTSSCSKLHILPTPTRLKNIVTQPHQEFVPFLHFKDPTQEQLAHHTLQEIQPSSLGHWNSQWLDLPCNGLTSHSCCTVLFPAALSISLATPEFTSPLLTSHRLFCLRARSTAWGNLKRIPHQDLYGPSKASDAPSLGMKTLQPRTPRRPLQGSRAQAGSAPQSPGGERPWQGGRCHQLRRAAERGTSLTDAHKSLSPRHLPAPSAPRSGPGDAWHRHGAGLSWGVPEPSRYLLWQREGSLVLPFWSITGAVWGMQGDEGRWVQWGAKKRRWTGLQLRDMEGSGRARGGRKERCCFGGRGQEERTVGAEGGQGTEGREGGG